MCFFTESLFPTPFQCPEEPLELSGEFCDCPTQMLVAADCSGFFQVFLSNTIDEWNIFVFGKP